MVCSHCKQTGHNYRTCPHLSQEEKDKILKENKKKKEETNQRRERWIQHQENLRQIHIETQKLSYEFVNQSDYDLAVYWGNENSNILKHFTYIQNHSVGDISCSKNHRICIFHSLQVINPEVPNQVISEININAVDDGRRDVGYLRRGAQRYSPIFDEYMKNINVNIIVLNKEFKPVKSEIELWKESSLKANYLLEQIIKLGGKKYENLEPMLDMVQDINIPTHNDYDRELAGIPSKLTNIT
jgi:hypothetical protein